jgi:hypothetical protein
MPQTASKRRSSSKSKSRRSSNGKPAKKQSGNQTVPERQYDNYTSIDPATISDSDEPDVLLDIPTVNVDEIHFELENLEARVSVHAEVLDIVTLSVGVHASLGKVELDIKGVEAQALFRARLDHVTAIIDRVLTTLDRNPAVLESVGRSIEQIGTGAGKGVGQIGQGAGQAVQDVGKGAGQAVEDVGEGAGGAVEDVGSGAGKAVGDVGEGVGQGAGQAVGQLGQGAGQAVGGLGQGAGQAVGGLGQGAAQLAGGGGGNGGSGGEGGDGQGLELTPGSLAKAAAMRVVKEIGAAASDEAKDLGLAATHKAAELGEKRRQRRAEKHNATEAALHEAETLGVDLDDVEGSGAEGRITVKDVRAASS